MLTFLELFDSYAPDIYRFSLWLSGNRLEAEDITSETLVRAWTRRESIRTETLKAYLFAIARNIYLQDRRKSKRRARLDENRPDPAPNPQEAVESKEKLEEIRQALLQISEADRTAFVLRVHYELPYEEIARILCVSLSAARVRVHRVRKRLLCMELEKEL